MWRRTVTAGSMVGYIHVVFLYLCWIVCPRVAVHGVATCTCTLLFVQCQLARSWLYLHVYTGCHTTNANVHIRSRISIYIFMYAPFISSMMEYKHEIDIALRKCKKKYGGGERGGLLYYTCTLTLVHMYIHKCICILRYYCSALS